MIKNQRDKEQQQEGHDRRNLSASSRLWSGLKSNPRVVRVSRAFGGKDRHSKVSTVRGLRDRRVRLSVPTAIQLYDLQDRLGLNQPSKVVDWLINAAQLEIDKLPPLQLPPEGFIQWNNNAGTHETSKQWRHSTGDETGGSSTKGNHNLVTPQVISHGQSSVPGFSSNTMPFPSSYQWEASNVYFSQSAEAPVMPTTSSRSLILEPQIVFCPPGMTMAPMSAPSVGTSGGDHFGGKTVQIGQLQMASSMPQARQSYNLEMNSSLHLSSPPTRHFQ